MTAQMRGVVPIRSLFSTMATNFRVASLTLIMWSGHSCPLILTLFLNLTELDSGPVWTLIAPE